MAALKVGDAAPDFDVPALIDGVKKRFKLSESKGKKNVILAFHPLNWTPVCTTMTCGYETDLKKFESLDTEVVGISVDSIMSHTAWEKTIGPLTYALASDFYPHGEVAQKYGVFRDKEPFSGVSERAIFVIDKAGKIAFSKVYPIGELPPNSDVLDVLQKLHSSK
jgi:peroxiredoxin (alkyl hydroperoxide reductase subunit C)